MEIQTCLHYDMLQPSGGLSFTVRSNGRVVTCHLPANLVEALPDHGPLFARFSESRALLEEGAANVPRPAGSLPPVRIIVSE